MAHLEKHRRGRREDGHPAPRPAARAGGDRPGPQQHAREHHGARAASGRTATLRPPVGPGARTACSCPRPARRNRQGQQLDQWIERVQADDLSALHAFVTGLGQDLDAVVAGLSLPYSSGAVEGHNNKIKMLKRQMFGRANFDLLRKRVLLAA
ncbi:transposase [Streptomyces sp. ALI-76-A]|uniref:transposase n=1 Tax=Streptomyces sp. ALI-76-A TaxID=3025736 RepID=UPI00256EE0F4|nr:transposase [Streptomyces sp. ALI-76-A]MDL5205321.1 transposase [Streptomyces sp. ALI-76-A]